MALYKFLYYYTIIALPPPPPPSSKDCDLYAALRVLGCGKGGKKYLTAVQVGLYRISHFFQQLSSSDLLPL